MELTAATCAKHLGGVRSIRLYGASDILSVAYDTRSKCFGLPQLKEGCSPLDLCFVEGSATFEERLGDNGVVTHRVGCDIAGAQPEAVERVRSFAREGVVALVTTADGGCYLVGYSPKAEGDYPLLLTEARVESHASRRESASTSLLLGSTDGWFSKPVVG